MGYHDADGVVQNGASRPTHAVLVGQRIAEEKQRAEAPGRHALPEVWVR
jgi:hypothetical protein